MSDDGTQRRVRAILRGQQESEEESPKQVDPSRASEQASGSREVREKHRAVGFCAVVVQMNLLFLH